MGTKLQIEESVMAIVIYHHEILYIKELIYGMPKFSLPKGHIEDGETKIGCAIRECYEETGIILEPSSYVKSLDSYTIKFTNNKLEEVEKKVKAVEKAVGHKVYAMSAIAKQGIFDCLLDLNQYIT